MITEIATNDRTAEYYERAKYVNAAGYEVLFEIPANTKIRNVERLAKAGYAVPVICGKAYLAKLLRECVE